MKIVSKKKQKRIEGVLETLRLSILNIGKGCDAINLTVDYLEEERDRDDQSESYFTPSEIKDDTRYISYGLRDMLEEIDTLRYLLNLKRER